MCTTFLIIPRNTQGLTAKVATANRKKEKVYNHYCELFQPKSLLKCRIQIITNKENFLRKYPTAQGRSEVLVYL